MSTSPTPRRSRYGMLVPWKDFNVHLTTTTQCAKGVEQKICPLAVEEMRESAGRAFQAYIRTLETVTSFKYLGRTLKALDDNLPSVVGNLRKARKRWYRLSRIVGREIASPKCQRCYLRWWFRRF